MVTLDSESVETIVIDELYDPTILNLDIVGQGIMFLVIVDFVISGSTVQQKD